MLALSGRVNLYGVVTIAWLMANCTANCEERNTLQKESQFVPNEQQKVVAVKGKRRRWQWTLFISNWLFVIAILYAVSSVRYLMLRAADWAFVASDSEEPADIIVIAIDAGPAGVLEATDLVHGGFAMRVAVFAESADPLQQEFARRGIPPSNQVARSIRLLNALGVTATEQTSPTPNGTEEEAQILPRWCDQNGFRTIIFVSTPDHSR